MRRFILWVLLGFGLCGPAYAEDRASRERTARLWYQAFDQNDPALLDRILDKDWVDIPAAPGQPAGPGGAKAVLSELTTSFPDLRIRIAEILQDGDKVIVRSEITGTQRAPFLGFPAKNGRLAIAAVDIHEIRNGRILRTWHMEDWMTGLRQLGVLDR